MLSTSVIYDLILYSAYISVLAFSATIAALVWMRMRRPELERPFKVPLAMPIALLFVLVGETESCFWSVKNNVENSDKMEAEAGSE